MIIDTDAKNEADDQYAVVHALLSPSLDVRGVIPAHFGTWRSDQSMTDSRAEVDLLLELMGRPGQVPVADGAAAAIPDEHTPADSPGARLIIAESRLATVEDRLYVAFLGPLTDMASAILLDPSLVDRPITVIWIGGEGHDALGLPRKTEFNLSNDIAAANVVFDSGVTLWQVPRPVYSLVSVSYTELEEKIGGTSELADYLIRQLVEWNATYHPGPIESRSLGDSPAISLRAYPQRGTFRTVPAPRFGAGGSLRSRRGTRHPGLRVRGCPLPARGHVRQDPPVRCREAAGTAPLNAVRSPKGNHDRSTRLRRRHLALRHLPGPLRHRRLRRTGGSIEQIDLAGAVGDLSVVDLNWPFAGFDGTLDDVKAALTRNDLRAIAITPESTPDLHQGFHHQPRSGRPGPGPGPAARGDRAGRGARCEYVKLWFGQDGWDYPFQVNYHDVWNLAVDALRELCDAHPEMTFVIEYKPREPRNKIIFPNAARTLLAIQQTGCDNLGVLLDFGHSLYGLETPADAAQLCIDHGKLFAIDVNDNFRGWDDDMVVGSVHLVETFEFFHTLRRNDWQGVWQLISPVPGGLGAGGQAGHHLPQGDPPRPGRPG